MAKDRTKANGEGTIYRRGKGYCGHYHVLTRDGAKKRRSVYAKTRAGAAEKSPPPYPTARPGARLRRRDPHARSIPG
jgi:hypothetical protein